MTSKSKSATPLEASYTAHRKATARRAEVHKWLLKREQRLQDRKPAPVVPEIEQDDVTRA